jgi:DNA (cytosine-5)-methyltransferase 1
VFLKKRKAKNSERGLYLQDIQLKETVFKPGTNYKYIVDNQNKQLLIVPTGEKGNTVSKRNLEIGMKPVIDIRNREALSVFSGMDYLEVEIFQDKVLVSGFKDEKEENRPIVYKIKKMAKKVLNNASNVVDITQKKVTNKEFEIILDKYQLKNVVGNSYNRNVSYAVSGNHYSSSFEFAEKNNDTFENIEIPLQVASLFSGAGVMDQGFKETGFTITMALEKNEDAVATYLLNHGNHIQKEDITTFNFKKFEENGASIMIGGPPCQGFSNANRQTNFLENPNNMLVQHYINAIKANPHCKVFVLENVPGILTAGNGQFKNEICEQLSEFEITSGVINSASMGSAQIRKRAIFIGSKIGRIELPKPKLEKPFYKTVWEAFKGLTKFIVNQLDFSKPKKSTIERMKEVPQGENWKSLPKHLKTTRMISGNTHSSVYRRLEWDKPSITLTNVRKSLIIHPVEHRILSIRECARLFGLPDSFEFKGTLSSMQQQISNAVPVELAKSIAEVIRKAIIKFNNKNTLGNVRWL